MAVYAHSFNPSIYGDVEYSSRLCGAQHHNEKRELKRLRKGTRLPYDVCEALVAMGERQWNRMCKDVFECSPDYVDLDTVLLKILETDLWSPGGDGIVTFWIDEEGYYTVDVYDETVHPPKRKIDD